MARSRALPGFLSQHERHGLPRECPRGLRGLAARRDHKAVLLEHADGRGVVPCGGGHERATRELTEHEGDGGRGDSTSPVIPRDPVSDGIDALIRRDIDRADDHPSSTNDTRGHTRYGAIRIRKYLLPSGAECLPVARLGACPKIGFTVELQSVKELDVGPRCSAQRDLWMGGSRHGRMVVKIACVPCFMEITCDAWIEAPPCLGQATAAFIFTIRVFNGCLFCDFPIYTSI